MAKDKGDWQWERYLPRDPERTEWPGRAEGHCAQNDKPATEELGLLRGDREVASG